MEWLLDTDVLSELRRLRPNPRVPAFLIEHPRESFLVSVVTLAELRFGIESLPEGLKRSELASWLNHEVRTEYEDRVLPITEDIMLRWRKLLADGRKRGKTLPQPDLIIAATAVEHGLVLATRNVKDFVGLPVQTFNPWDEPVH